MAFDLMAFLETGTTGDTEMDAEADRLVAEADAEQARLLARIDAERAEIERFRCGRCGGTGRLGQFAHIEGGSCFGCNGTGDRRARIG